MAAVDGVTFQIGPAEIVGLVGESGSGKTTLGLSLLGLLAPAARTIRGSIRWRGESVLGLPESRLEALRGSEIAFISQEPGIALHPLMRVGDQIAKVLRAHRSWSLGRCRSEAERLIEEVGLPEPARTASAYPHELSGGQRQRVTIAQAIACRPALVIADEPTSALDTTTRMEILGLLGDLKDRLGLALLLVTHDLGSLVALASRVLVMYAGRIVEDGPLQRVCGEPRHPYTQALLACRPRLGAESGARRFPSIGGGPPDMARLPVGCAFEPRCPDRMDLCVTRLPLAVFSESGQRVTCFKHGG